MGCQREAEDQIEEIQQRLLAKESDLTRIRAQREEFRADATELRAKESEKIRNSDQLRTLAESRAVCLFFLGFEERES